MNIDTKITVMTCLHLEMQRHAQNAKDERFSEDYRAEAERWVERIHSAIEELGQIEATPNE